LLRRQRDLLSLLLNAEGVMTGAELSVAMGVSVRTIQIDIKRINQYLVPYRIGITSLRKQGYLLTESHKQVMKSHDIIRSVVDVAYLIQPPSTPDERVMFILLRLINRRFYRIEALESDLSISNSTLNGDIFLAKRWLKQHIGSQAKLAVSLKSGVSLKADEKSRIHIISRYLCLHTNISFTNKCYDYLFGQIDDKQQRYCEQIFSVLHHVTHQYGYWLTGHSHHFLCHLMTIIFIRTELVQMSSIEHDDADLRPVIEALNIELQLCIPVSLDRGVWHLIQRYFLSCQLLNQTDLANLYRPDNDVLLVRYYDQIWRRFGVDLAKSDRFCDSLQRYLGPMLNRLEHHHRIPDAIGTNLLHEHRLESLMAETLRDLIKQMFELEMTDEELAYIGLYLINSRAQWCPPTAIYIVSDLDQSVIDYMIQTVILPLADKVQLIGMCTYQQFFHFPPSDQYQIDLLLTTSTMADKTDLPTLHFNVNLNSQKILEIQQRILQFNQ
jgi:lichenan operon transcriptional antiterminator